jgi:hypothetical protein
MDFKLDRSAFKVSPRENQKESREYWLQKTPMERFAAAWYLTAYAYGIDYMNPPPLDRNAFSMRKHGE